MSDTIPNPLESGQSTLDGGTFTGNVGSADENTQPTLSLEHGATVTAATAGFDSSSGVLQQTRFSTFDVKQSDTLNINAIGARGGPGPGVETVNVEPGGRVDLGVQQIFGDLTVNGGNGARVGNFNGTISSASATVQPDIDGTGTVTLTGSLPEAGAGLALNGAVSAGETINLDAGSLQLNDPMRFQGTIDWLPNGATFGSDFGFATTTLAGVNADSYTLNNDTLSLFQGNNDFLNLHLTNPTNAPLNVSQGSQGVVLSQIGPQFENTTPLPIHTAMS